MNLNSDLLKAPINHGDKCEESVRLSLENLCTTYLDLVLIHWPGVKGLKLADVRHCEQRKLTYQSLEKLHLDGRIHLIGVSNYNQIHLNDLFTYAKVKPHLLQV